MKSLNIIDIESDKEKLIKMTVLEKLLVPKKGTY